MTNPPHITDSHCHLDFPDFDGQLPDIIARAAEAGVEEDAPRRPQVSAVHLPRCIEGAWGVHVHGVCMCMACVAVTGTGLREARPAQPSALRGSSKGQ